ncbi:MAG: HAD-IIA family hydrolase [Propionibacteriaceae bacterium]
MSTTQGLMIEGYDAALFDLDGVVYLGPDPVPGAAEGISALRELDVRVGFVTNNAARPPDAVAIHLRELGIPAEAADVVTSAQAGARLLVERFGTGARVLAVGGAGVQAALEEAGLIAVGSADDAPAAVMQGYDPNLSWQLITEAALAVQRGAHWLATNTDPTRPTDRGLVPGNGAAVQAVRTAVDVDPEVAGKPYPPLIAETIRRLDAGRAIFVGDRLDTDIEGAVRLGLDSLLVLTGSHGPKDLLAAEPGSRPTYVGADLRALVQPAPVVAPDVDSVRCGEQTARLVDGGITLDREPTTPGSWLDALWAAAQLTWATADAGRTCRTADVLTTLDRGPAAHVDRS